MPSTRVVRTIGDRLHPPALPCALVAALALTSCYTVRVSYEKEKVSKTDSAARVLHETIFEYTQETFYAFPQIATRAGVHRHKLANGEVVRLDRELPNFSEEVIAARVDALKAYLERLDQGARPEALSPNDRADRRLVVDAMKAELAVWEDREEHTSNPLLHAAALAESLYYPLAIDYAPEKERLADVLGRLQWVPSFVDRAVRMTKAGTEAQFQAAAAVNRFSAEIVKAELGARIGDDAELKTSYDGMKGSVLDALAKLQGFLDAGAKEKRTFRFGADRYREHVALLWHGAADPGELGAAAKQRIEDLKRELYELAKPAYCEANETDRKTCGPTRAEIAAAKKAEEDKIRKEEAAAKKAEEKKQREEEAAAKKAEEERKREEEAAAKKAAAEEAAAEKKAEEEAKKAAAEKAKKKSEKLEKEYSNPYEDKPKAAPEKKGKGDIENPYGALIRPAPTVLGAKQADAAEKGEKPAKEEKKPAKEEKKPAKEEKKAEEKKPAAEEKAAPDKQPAAEEKAPEAEKSAAEPPASGSAVDKVIGFVLGRLAAQKPAGPGAADRLARAISAARKRAAEIGFLEASDAPIAVAPMPAMLAATQWVFALSPAPPFEPAEGARVFVSEVPPTAPLADLSRGWMTAAAALWGAPGMAEVYGRAAKIEPQTRRAARVVFGDAAFVEGFGLYAAIAVVGGGSDEEEADARLVALALELRAAVSALVDLGLHTEGTSEAEAVALLKRDAYCDQANAENRVAFAKLYPGALATPFVGLERWRALREEAAKKDGFEAAPFHAAALAAGPVALSDLAAILGGDADARPDLADEPRGPTETEPKLTFMGAE
jgi:hypothetical protein